MKFRSTSMLVFLVLVAIALLLLAGCANNEFGAAGKIVRTDITPIYQDGSLQTVRFESKIQSTGIGQSYQIRYEVVLVDRNGQPVQSSDGRYQIPSGQVAAARTAIVPGVDHIETMRVSIPANQLELYAKQLPASAEIRIYQGLDHLLTHESHQLPIQQATTQPHEEEAAEEEGNLKIKT